MRSTADTAELNALRARTLNVLREAIGPATHVAVLDAPNQRNVGDTLIWLGELAYLKQLGYTISHVSDLRAYDADTVRAQLPQGGVILLHGGGNFGDLWVGHQRLRERIVTELQDYRVVQLPQSIYFADESRAEMADRILSSHPDFVALLRDSLSQTRAADQLPSVRTVFCPDMAFGYEPPDCSRAADGSVLVIARADLESASGLRQHIEDALPGIQISVTDWWKDRDEPAKWKRARRIAFVTQLLVRVRRKLRLKTGLRIPFPQMPRRYATKAIYDINEANIEYALSLYAGARLLIADRLHAHVLALLLGLDHVVMDNNYRKIGGVVDDYSGRFSTVNYAAELDTATQLTRGLIS